jgi:ketosteroid isomerase-like protein
MKNQFFMAVVAIALFLISCKAENATDENASAAMVADSTDAKPPAEFADPKYVDMVRSGLDAFEKGDIAGWLSFYSDDAVYSWNNGDSLAGKQAISDYWTKRRAEVIDSLTFSDHIFVPLRVNTSQSVEDTGVWVLAWYQIDAKYKTGKSMTQWSHADLHFNADGKIDQSIHYIDRAPINEASK